MHLRALVVLLAAAAAVGTGAWPAAGQPAGAPRLVNGRVETRAGGDIAAVVRSVPSGADAVSWVGWSVPADGTADRCCWNDWQGSGGCCGACRLEREGAAATPAAPSPGAAATAAPAAPAPVAAAPMPIEPGAGRVVVLARIAGGRVERVRTYAPTCALDAGGRTVVWLSGVTPEASVAWLDAQVSSAARRVADDVLMTLSAHAAPRALDRLLDYARSGDTARLRGQALFWLSQRAGERAVGAIADAIDRDPDTDVKRKAVFALSQLPADQGVPRLIEVARAHSNPAVRKQAFFWLGQSSDPRALAFFADVLKR